MRLSIIILLGMIAGCGKVLLKPDMARVAHESAAYREGYKEGCNSGYVAGGYLLSSFKRDSKRITEDEQYKAGWKKGYKVCKDEFREMCREGALLSEATLHCSDVRQQGLDKVD